MKLILTRNEMEKVVELFDDSMVLGCDLTIECNEFFGLTKDQASEAIEARDQMIQQFKTLVENGSVNDGESFEFEVEEQVAMMILNASIEINKDSARLTKKIMKFAIKYKKQIKMLFDYINATLNTFGDIICKPTKEQMKDVEEVESEFELFKTKIESTLSKYKI